MKIVQHPLWKMESAVISSGLSLIVLAFGVNICAAESAAAGLDPDWLRLF